MTSIQSSRQNEYAGAYARLTPSDLAELLAKLMTLAAAELARPASPQPRH